MSLNEKLADLVFFSKWLKSPLQVASVTPSSARLARAMAAALPGREGLVVELGAGTGPVTRALLASGVNPEHLVVVERDPHFCRMLARRFPGVTVIDGDAFELQSLIGRMGSPLPVRAVVSGLPLVPMRAAAQAHLLGQAMALTGGSGPFVQFSYGLTSPVKKPVEQALELVPRCVAQVWRNVPPAKVWSYAQEAAPAGRRTH